MKINVRLCGNAPNLRKRLHGTQLVVGLHHRNQHSFFTDGPPHLVKGNQAIAVDRQITDLYATLFKSLAGIQHRFVFDARRDDVLVNRGSPGGA